MKKGILRIIFVNFLSVLIVIYSFSFCFKNYNVKGYEKEVITLKKETIESEKKIEKEETKKEETNSSVSSENENKVTSSQTKEKVNQVSAKAIKGNIISQYNSPYKAPLSYDGVYVKNNTSLKINIKKYLEGKIKFKIEKNSQPQVLILHTHATESFMLEDSDVYTEDFKPRSTDNSKNMVAIGNEVANILNNAGIKTVHSKVQHDYPNYTGSYNRAAETINYYLKKYPSIKVILDLHRDSVSNGNDKVKLVTEINGKKAAQVMLVMGSQSDGVTNFPKWEENFKLAVKLQQNIEKSYPTLARPVYLMPKIYNQNITTGSLLIEFGTDGNTLNEAVYSAKMVGKSIVKTLNELG